MAPAIRSTPPRSYRSSRPLRSSRTKVQSYYEESDTETSNGDNGSDNESFTNTLVSLRPRRMPASYREDSTDDGLDEEEDDDNDADDTLFAEPLSRRTQFIPELFNGRSSSSQHGSTVAAKSQTRKPTQPSNKRKLERGGPCRKTKQRKVEAVEPVCVDPGVIPPWQTLPYHVLFDIFFYASHPLVGKRAEVRFSSAQWLVNVALLCRTFHEPALAALYYCPPLVPAAKCHGLLSLLSNPQERLSTTYTSKIKILDVHVETALLHKGGPALGYFDLTRLIEKTPQLKVLRLYHHYDDILGIPPWQIPQSRWIYPENLFVSINSISGLLRSWDWNSRFMETENLLPLIFRVHQQRAFQGLRELRLLHLYGTFPEEEYVVSGRRELTLAAALKELPELQSLEFRGCSIVNDHLLSNMPSALTSLTIDDCDEVNASNLGAYLASNGFHIRELILKHNRNLSLSFLAGLAHACQHLERLIVDISLYDRSSYHDVEPHFEELLNASEVPTWPSTLQEIEFNQLRNWDDITAEVFLASLVEAAPTLRDLRRLVISAILKIGWRDRASFRERWIGRLETIFLRRSTPPNPKLSTLRPEHDESTTGASANPDTKAESKADSVLLTPSKRKSARLAQRKISEIEDQSDVEHEQNEPPSQPEFIQGMCDIVNIRIDNQRPTETQFNENDFLDDEQSGDEDWSGADFDYHDGYAW